MKIKTILTLILIILPLNVYGNFLKLNTPAKQVILYDHELKKVLFEKNSNDLMKPASMAKIMTAYIVFDRLQEGSLNLDDTFVVSKNAWQKGGSRTFLKLNSEVTIRDLLMGLIVQSGNDAAIVLAEGIAGSEEDFAIQMNQYANSLEMKNTYFTNSTGWPHEDLKTTAYDLIILTEALINNFPKLYKLFVEKEFTFNNIRQPNRNPLLIGRYKVPGADGLKINGVLITELDGQSSTSVNANDKSYFGRMALKVKPYTPYITKPNEALLNNCCFGGTFNTNNG